MRITYLETDNSSTIEIEFFEDDVLTDKNHSKWDKRLKSFISKLDNFYPLYEFKNALVYFGGVVETFDKQTFDSSTTYSFIRACFNETKRIKRD